MVRHIFIGDIHGCFDELSDLLAAIGVGGEDRVVSLGDMTRKGPAADRCLDLWAERGYLAVLGNGDAATIERSRSPIKRWLAAAADRRVLRSRRYIAQIQTWPLHLDFPAIGVVAVHGGILPNSRRFDPSLAPRSAALELRHVRRAPSGQWMQIPKGQHEEGDPFWADVWDGDRTVVYGHTPRHEAKIHARAIGLDTGCVYGGELSAAVFASDGTYRIVEVRARRRYSR